MKVKTVYLSHPFDTRESVRTWEVNHPFSFKFINPFFIKENVEVFNDKDVSSDDYYKRLDSNRVVENDLKLINKCDVLLAIIDGSVSYGTIMEIVYAKHYKKGVIILCTNGHHNHPWIKYHADQLFTSYEELNKFLETI